MVGSAVREREATGGRQSLGYSSGKLGMRKLSAEKLRPDETALFLDVDGTMIDFADSPAEVIVPAGLVEDIDAIERALGGALALISGRTIADLDRLFHPLSFRASGVHGAEIRYEPSAAVPTVETARVLSRDLWLSLNEALSAFPGALAENKRYSFAIHYRAAPSLGPRLQAALREFVAASGDTELEIINAHFAFEIKGDDFNKGFAIDQFLARPPFVGRVPIFIGDDWTDEAGFAAVVRAGGTAYAVGESRPHASGLFSGPDMVREWLAQAAAQMALS